MASVRCSIFPVLLLLLMIASLLPSTAVSQNPIPIGTSPSIPGPTIAECGTSLLPLASCAPFVQGTVPYPAQPCCDGLKQLYNHQPNCLCLLLNDTTLTSFPINSTLALQLPLLCSLQADTSTCSGVPLPPTSPASQVSFGTNTNSTVAAASPRVTVTPKPGIMGTGYGQSNGARSKMGGQLVVAARLKMEGQFVVAVAAAVTTFLCTK